MNYKYSYIVGPDTILTLTESLNKIFNEGTICVFHGGGTGSHIIIIKFEENKFTFSTLDGSRAAQKLFGIHVQFAKAVGDKANISCAREGIEFVGSFNHLTNEFTILEFRTQSKTVLKKSAAKIEVFAD